MSGFGEFDAAVQDRLGRLREELADAQASDDYATAAWVESAMLDLQRLQRENGPSGASSLDGAPA